MYLKQNILIDDYDMNNKQLESQKQHSGSAPKTQNPYLSSYSLKTNNVGGTKTFVNSKPTTESNTHIFSIGSFGSNNGSSISELLNTSSRNSLADSGHVKNSDSSRNNGLIEICKQHHLELNTKLDQVKSEIEFEISSVKKSIEIITIDIHEFKSEIFSLKMQTEAVFKILTEITCQMKEIKEISNIMLQFQKSQNHYCYKETDTNNFHDTKKTPDQLKIIELEEQIKILKQEALDIQLARKTNKEIRNFYKNGNTLPFVASRTTGVQPFGELLKKLDGEIH